MPNASKDKGDRGEREANAEQPSELDPRLVERIATGLVAIESNYYRETSGPGSRFDGQRLEIVQALWVIKEVRRALSEGRA